MRPAAKMALLLLAILPVVSGCGRKGALVPPEALVPAAVETLAAQQQGDLIRLSWVAPGKEKSGRPLKDLAGFRLQRRDIRRDGSDCAACADSWQLLKEIDATLPTGNGGFVYLDSRPAGTVSQYRLTAFSRSGGTGPAALTAELLMLPPLPPPSMTLKLLPSAIRISLSCNPAADSRLKGYNIYRRQSAGGAQPSLLGKASADGVWEDRLLNPGSRYSYSATSLLERNGVITESLPSPELDLVYSLEEFP